MIKSNLFGKEVVTNADALMLTNGIGGYFYYSPTQISKYQGFCINDNNKMFKIIDRIRLNNFKINEILFDGSEIEASNESEYQKFLLVKEKNCLIYETNSKDASFFDFDCRESFDMTDWGRFYDIIVKDNMIIIRYNKRKDEKNSSSTEYELYTVICADNIKLNRLGNWNESKYSFDMKRNDGKSRFIYEAFSLKVKKAVICSSFSKEEAIKSAKEVYLSIKKIKSDTKNNIKLVSVKTKNERVNYAYALSSIALRSLIVKSNENKFIFAGLPWFFQFWTRDTAMSLKGINLINETDFVKSELLYYINNIKEDGLIPNILPQSGLNSIDGIGLIFYRISEFIALFSDKELRIIYDRLRKTVYSLSKNYFENNLLVNKKHETWMDTQNREGARIEVQALFLSMLSLLKLLSNKFEDKEEYNRTQEKEVLIKNKVRSAFFRNGYLYDGANDPVIRPNIFLAFYFYPELLAKSEWINVFDNVLDFLWLDWGGISTLDKRNIDFLDKHTGVDDKSYHNGDSWFYLNNLAALVLNALDNKRYKKYIDKIIQSSTNEILDSGIFGYHAELSSAALFESNGCLAQAWSSALYLELINTIGKYDVNS